MEITIRKFRDKDQVQAHILIKTILKEEFAVDEHLYAGIDLINIQNAYNGKRDVFFVAVCNDVVVGTAAIKEDDEETALLRRVFVAPEFRGKGIGIELISKTVEFCGKNGYQRINFRATERMQAAINNLCSKHSFKLKESVQMGPVKILKLSRKLHHKKKL